MYIFPEEEMADEQLSLLPGSKEKDRSPGGLKATSPLSQALEAFREYMVSRDFTENTIKSFLSDLNITADYLGHNKPVGQIATQDLNDFLDYLLHRRGKPCSPKSYARRVTALKVFFAWLAKSKVIPTDPAAPVVHRPARSPLPTILSDEQVECLLEAARRLRDGEEADARPYLLITLLLQTGIKKSEAMNIRLRDIDLSDPQSPTLWVRYANPRHQHKERKVKLPADFAATLRQYREQYEPQEYLFTCTARNLEYVLHRVAQLAGISGGISFESLRWTCAVRDYRAGMAPEQLRQKLGVSPARWEEIQEIIKKLTQSPL